MYGPGPRELCCCKIVEPEIWNYGWNLITAMGFPYKIIFFVQNQWWDLLSYVLQNIYCVLEVSHNASLVWLKMSNRTYLGVFYVLLICIFKKAIFKGGCVRFRFDRW